MTHKIKKTVRLNEQRSDKLARLAEQRDCSESEVVRQLIDNAGPGSQTMAEVARDVKDLKQYFGLDEAAEAAIPGGQPAPSAPTQADPAGSESVDVLDEDGEEIMTADDGSGSGSVDGELPTTNDASASAGTELIIADGGQEVSTEALSPSHVEEYDLVIPPNDYSDKLKQDVTTTMGLIKGVINWLWENRISESQSRSEFVRTIGMVTGRGDETAEDYADSMINRQHVYTHLLADPMLEEQWDDLLIDVYGGDEYETRKDRGELPEDLSDLLGGWWVEKASDPQVYRDQEVYVAEMRGLLRSIEGQLRKKFARERMRDKRPDEWQAWSQTYLRLGKIAEARSGGEIPADRCSTYYSMLLSDDLVSDAVAEEWTREDGYQGRPEVSELESGDDDAGSSYAFDEDVWTQSVDDE